ncbi:hypothetical protein F4823DRAFT_308043 [Ustulina deusta]|nr:hypothetical protein F4823DRAFT_308043 [Ustulina deusta]
MRMAVAVLGGNKCSFWPPSFHRQKVQGDADSEAVHAVAYLISHACLSRGYALLIAQTKSANYLHKIDGLLLLHFWPRKTMTPRIDNLKEEIQDNLVTSISEHRFLPIDKLDKIFTPAAIKDAVKELACGPEDRINLAETIHNEGKRVFGMLIYNGWQDLIIEFRKHGALDNRLPLSENEAVTITGRSIGRQLAQDAQWAFCPYVFPESLWKHHHQVERKMILPFIDTEQIGSGAFSVVEKISISPSQQNFIDKGTAIV